MNKFIENVNTYISQRKIKQTYISMKSGIETNKLSRILNGKQEITATDMDKLATALGKSIEFFLKDEFEIKPINSLGPAKAEFCTGDPTAEQQRVADKLVELIETMDIVMSAKGRFMSISKE